MLISSLTSEYNELKKECRKCEKLVDKNIIVDNFGIFVDKIIKSTKLTGKV